MKTQKLENHTIYEVVNLQGANFFINFEPTQEELKELCCEEFGWIVGLFDESDYIINKLHILEKKNYEE